MMTRSTIILAILCIGGLLVGRAVADDGTTTGSTSEPDKSQYWLFNPTPQNLMREMDTDRPDKTDSPLTIDAGHLQLETGIFDYSYDRDQYQGADARIETLELGEFDFRLGVLNNVELDLDISSWNYLKVNDYIANQSTYQNGFGDTTIGAKFNLWGDDDADAVWDTAFGLQPQLKIPTARPEIGNGYVEGSLGFPFLINLPAEFELEAETTVSDQRNDDNTGYVAGWQNSASLSREFFEKLDLYIEYWSEVTTQSHQIAQQTLDTGFTYQVAENVVVDTGFNFGLNKASETFEVTSGISLRF